MYALELIVSSHATKSAGISPLASHMTVAICDSGLCIYVTKTVLALHWQVFGFWFLMMHRNLVTS